MAVLLPPCHKQALMGNPNKMAAHQQSVLGLCLGQLARGSTMILQMNGPAGAVI